MKTKQEMWMRADELGSPGGSLTTAFQNKTNKYRQLIIKRLHTNIMSTNIKLNIVYLKE